MQARINWPSVSCGVETLVISDKLSDGSATDGILSNYNTSCSLTIICVIGCSGKLNPLFHVLFLSLVSSPVPAFRHIEWNIEKLWMSLGTSATLKSWEWAGDETTCMLYLRDMVCVCVFYVCSSYVKEKRSV